MFPVGARNATGAQVNAPPTETPRAGLSQVQTQSV